MALVYHLPCTSCWKELRSISLVTCSFIYGVGGASCLGRAQQLLLGCSYQRMWILRLEW